MKSFLVNISAQKQCEGETDLAEIIDQLYQTGYRGPITVLIDDAGTCSLAADTNLIAANDD